ncbi:MAG: hypothetical protein JXR76_28455 [Deltaproteobacteria bacterium]|nr:hypothetical protein [Deltaproteobacteria bacterium]
MTDSVQEQDLIHMSATRMAEAVRQREISVEAIVSAHIRQINRVNGLLNAVIYPMFDEALAAARAADCQLAAGEARGQLFGVPMTIKDQYMVKGTPTWLGLAKALDPDGHREGPLVARLREEGAIFLGKTNVPQLCLTYLSDHARFGSACNPWNTARVPGGSSGGEAAIIAAKGSPLGLGGDMGGSLRVPAHKCGIHTIKPTGCRFPNDDSPLFPDKLGAFAGFEPYTTQPGPMARHVDDLKLMMDALLTRPLSSKTLHAQTPWTPGPVAEARGLRIGYYSSHPFFPASSGVQRVVNDAVEILKDIGFSVVPFEYPEFEDAFRIAIRLISAAGANWINQALGRDAPTPVVKHLKTSLSMGKMMRGAMCGMLRKMGQATSAKLLADTAPSSANVFQRLTAERTEMRARFLHQMDAEHIDIIICPAFALPAVSHGDDVGAMTMAGCYSLIFNLLGNPAGVVAASRVRASETARRPAAKDLIFKAAKKVDEGSEGLPLGVQVVGRYWREDQVLSVMKTLETEFRTRDDYPDWRMNSTL